MIWHEVHHRLQLSDANITPMIESKWLHCKTQRVEGCGHCWEVRENQWGCNTTSYSLFRRSCFLVLCGGDFFATSSGVINDGASATLVFCNKDCVSKWCMSLGYLLWRSLWRNGSLVFNSVALVVSVAIAVWLLFCHVCFLTFVVLPSLRLLFNIIGSSPT